MTIEQTNRQLDGARMAMDALRAEHMEQAARTEQALLRLRQAEAYMQTLLAYKAAQLTQQAILEHCDDPTKAAQLPGTQLPKACLAANDAVRFAAENAVSVAKRALEASPAAPIFKSTEAETERDLAEQELSLTERQR